ncbi:hypothetical protein ACFV2V_15830 [Streptomyces sp. NPDC059698]|uniref:hypothetical protein n=1 Tax=unclassified Streptomyces TaxID=2593676 RepID=UPI00093F1189|nr:hypothetical protein [Streptomyces sp. CB02366]OKJ33393.1 hypothetical protein AMK24_24245 [Streptomyces sp. CB02366]TVP38405.1 hypothetical protein A3L22_22570 [Streptomyces griseus subsp. griseus]
MSSNDQQYPYPYDPERQPYGAERRPAPQHWPDGTAGGPVAHGEPDAFDQGATQTWQAPTWDTQYQPTIRRDGGLPGGPDHGGPERAEGYGTAQPGPYGMPESGPYAPPRPGPQATPEPHLPYQEQHQHQYQEPQAYRPQQPYQEEPQERQQYLPHQEPQAYQSPEQQHYHQGQQPPHHQGQQPPPYQEPQYHQQPYPAPVGTGSLPLPPEVPVAPAAPAAPVAPVPPVASAPAPEGAAAQPGAADGTGYGAPTTLGNARLTDAQRARAEGRSPIIAPGMQPAAITAVLGLLLAGGAALGTYALLVPVVLLQAVTAAGWFRLNGMWPARQGIALAFAGGLAADVVLLVAGREHGPAALLGTLGVWVLLTVVLQLRSHAGADERMYGLMATVVSASLAVLAGGHLAAAPDAVVAGGAAVAAAVLVRALPLPVAASVAAALLAGAGAGLAVGGLTDFGAKGALLGLAAGGCAVIGLRVASYDYPSRFVHMTAGVALPLTLAAPAVYLLGRMLL